MTFSLSTSGKRAVVAAALADSNLPQAAKDLVTTTIEGTDADADISVSVSGNADAASFSGSFNINQAPAAQATEQSESKAE